MKENCGVCYIKFVKVFLVVWVCEEMDGKIIVDDFKLIKVCFDYDKFRF